MKRWSDEEDKYLIKHYHKEQIDVLCRELGKTRQAIHNRRIRLIKSGVEFKSKRNFLSAYWKFQYKTNQLLIRKHKKSIEKLWKDKEFNIRHVRGIKKWFDNPFFREKHRQEFIKRRKTPEFVRRQKEIASRLMTDRHNDPVKHKQILENLRRNPSGQQLFAVTLLKRIFGEESVGCSDWNILDGRMEVDIPVYPLKVAIEWDGEYWHSRLKNAKKRDIKKNQELIKRGWKVVRVLARSNPPMSYQDIENQFEKILSAIKSDKILSFVEVN